MRLIALSINGRSVTTAVEDGETLLELLRDRFHLKGTKKGCEVGECGACTVLVDGVPTASCIFLAAEADGKAILTIEGLSNGKELHPVQKAFIKKGAIQCGFCTPGMVLSAYALLKDNPDPTVDEIKRGLSGNMCRCAAYVQIVEAVREAADMMSEEERELEALL